MLKTLSESIELVEVFSLPQNVSEELDKTPTEQEKITNLPNKVAYNLELKDFKLYGNAIGLSLKINTNLISSNARTESWSPDWTSGSFVTTGAGVTKLLVTNYSLQKAHTEYYSKSSSWSLWWSSEGSRFLPASGGYWEYCRLNKHGLKVTFSYDRQQGGYVLVTTYRTTKC
jgi:hypothetical protein